MKRENPNITFSFETFWLPNTVYLPKTTVTILQKPRSLPSKNQAQKYLFHEVYDALLVVEAKVPGVEESLGVSGVVLPALVAPHQLDCLHAQLTL